MTRRPPRLATSLGLLLAAGGIVAVPSPASAVPLESGVLDAATEVSSGNEGIDPTQCTVDATGADKPPVVLELGKQSQNETKNATITHNTDATDVTHLSAKSSVSSAATAKDGSLRRLDLKMTGTSTVDADLGKDSLCDTTATAEIVASFIFTAKEDGWLTIDSASTAKPAFYTAVLLSETTGTQEQIVQFASKGTRTERFFVEADRYMIQVDYGILNITPQPGDPFGKKQSGSLKMSVAYAPAGTAKAPASGPASKAVTFANKVACGAKTLKLVWKKPAGKASLAEVRVNGKRVATVHDPKPGKALVLKHIPATATTKVQVALGRSTATRTYEPCS